MAPIECTGQGWVDMLGRSERRTRVEFLTLIASFAIVLGACSATPQATPPGSTTPQASTDAPTSAAPSAVLSDLPSSAPSAVPSDAPTQAPAPTPKPTGKPAPTPTPLPAVTGWTAAAVAISGSNCFGASAQIDSANRLHIVATCGSGITYAVASVGGKWTTTKFPAPSGRQIVDPMLAVDGSTTYLAYSLISDGACGGPLDTGVYVKTQSTPGGSWTAATRIGSAGDGLESFAEMGGTLDAVVLGGSKSYFETVAGATAHRYLISDVQAGASDPVSLQMGTDGKARIAYTSDAGIRYGVFNGSGFTTTTIEKQDGFEWGAQLILDASNNPRILWMHSPPPLGCAGPDPTSKDGTYYATDAGGTWTSTRFTTDYGQIAFQRNDTTGVVYAVVTGYSEMDLYTRTSGGAWQTASLTRLASNDPILVRNSATGTMLFVFSVPGKGAYAMTRPGS